MDNPKYIIRTNIYKYLLISIVPFVFIEFLIYDFNFIGMYRGITIQNDPFLLYAFSTALFFHCYMYIEISYYEDKIIFRKLFWFRNRNFEIRIDQIQSIKCYAGRGEFIDIVYLKDGKTMKKHFEFMTFRFKELQKAITFISNKIESKG